ncbi:hypothetical protein DY000_02002691 [Brassica cretica]|uniref:RNase H type-1 domain-containing protein n=1 Tax=Brassica cretica TaxID=69181 RepID=A0ABQ7CIV6_BRACR|nr:hypothetical protein DY000_02002691 [Brassica cretica]
MAREWQNGQVATVAMKRTSGPHPHATNGLDTNSTSSFAAIENNVNSPLMAEGLALREALLEICNLGIVSLSVQANSKILITSIINRSLVPELYGVVADILCISAAFESLSFRWIPREENTNDDLLTKQVLSVNEAFMSST